MENPIGLQGVDYMEFTCENPQDNLLGLFRRLGFQTSATGTDKIMLQQGQIRFLINDTKNDSNQARQYFKNHGEGVSKVAFLVDDCEKAIQTACERGGVQVADLTTEETPDGIIKRAAIQGFGDIHNEFVERPKSQLGMGLNKIDGAPEDQPLTTRCSRIDHFTNNVPYGEMDKWVEFYKNVYGFRETRYFDIKGVNTGLYSKVVQSADNNIIIPINQPERADGKSQIQEFLDRHNGAGVQHIALMTPDIISTTKELIKRDVKFLNTPDTYYEMVDKRGFDLKEDIEVMKEIKLLADGDEEGYLLQIFSDTYIGPLFFEYIQRKNHWGFGEGNFQALFDSIELDQKQRGYL